MLLKKLFVVLYHNQKVSFHVKKINVHVKILQENISNKSDCVTVVKICKLQKSPLPQTKRSRHNLYLGTYSCPLFYLSRHAPARTLRLITFSLVILIIINMNTVQDFPRNFPANVTVVRKCVTMCASEPGPGGDVALMRAGQQKSGKRNTAQII